MTRVDLFALIDKIATMMRPMAVSKQLNLEFHVEDSLRQYLMGDDLRLQQILANLVGNALKFTPRGSVAVRVSQVSENQQAVAVRYEVRDTGIGVSRTMQSKIFEEFTQVEQGLERSYGGSGLGLSICRQLAKRMGTQINVKSELGVGSTFWFDLIMPFEPSDSVPEVNDCEPTEMATRGGKVLVVGSNEVNMIVLEAILEKLGCDNRCIGSGPEAVELLRGERFDLVFMEVQPPDMEGIQSSREIRGLPFPACAVPIIALTASYMKQDENVWNTAGMNDYIGLPVSEKVISQVLTHWLTPLEARQVI
jgi:CheY-like chemotaxis protein